MLLAPQINGTKGPAISRSVPGTYFEMDYPGGNVVWAVSTVLISYATSGTASFGFKNLSLILQLVKR